MASHLIPRQRHRLRPTMTLMIAVVMMSAMLTQHTCAANATPTPTSTPTPDPLSIRRLFPSLAPLLEIDEFGNAALRTPSPGEVGGDGYSIIEEPKAHPDASYSVVVRSAIISPVPVRAIEEVWFSIDLDSETGSRELNWESAQIYYVNDAQTSGRHAWGAGLKGMPLGWRAANVNDVMQTKFGVNIVLTYTQCRCYATVTPTSTPTKTYIDEYDELEEDETEIYFDFEEEDEVSV